MRIALGDHASDLASYVPEFKSRSLSFHEVGPLPSRVLTGRRLASPRDLRQCDLAFLFAYDIFPPAILKFFGEWQLERRHMREGDVIVQQAQVPPGWGVRLIFGVRVLRVYRDERRAGFSYGTLGGHPETGTNEFSFSMSDGGIAAAVHTVAAPAQPLARLLAPVFTNSYIAYCNRQALRQMETMFLGRN
jgi:hypothetical protein